MSKDVNIYSHWEHTSLNPEGYSSVQYLSIPSTNTGIDLALTSHISFTIAAFRHLLFGTTIVKDPSFFLYVLCIGSVHLAQYKIDLFLFNSAQ